MDTPIYGLEFSKRVLEEFLASKGRGYRVLRRVYPSISRVMAIWLFRYDQERWIIFKKLVKLCDRLSSNPDLSYDFIRMKCLTNVKYFRAYGKKFHTFKGKIVERVLDTSELRSLDY